MGAVLGPVPACWAKCRGVDAGTCKRTFYHRSVPVTMGAAPASISLGQNSYPLLRPLRGGGGVCRFLRTLTNQHMAQPPAAPQSQTALPQKKKKIPTGSRERSLRSPQPQRPNVVSEWARKRKRTGNHIEHVRTDAGCRGGCPDQVVIVIASRVTVLQLHILSRKFPPFLGFLSVADRTTNETK